MTTGPPRCRPGRFDRQIVVDKPDLLGRIDILKIHTRELTMAPDVNLETVAKRTPGFVGADLANVANEAAILAARKNRDAITTEDFEAAIDRVIAGPEKKKNTLGPDEKHRVSFHESGHTLVAELVPTGEPVHKVSIIPRGIGALGYTLQLPEKEKFLATKNELLDQIAILLGAGWRKKPSLETFPRVPRMTWNGHRMLLGTWFVPMA